MSRTQLIVILVCIGVILMGLGKALYKRLPPAFTPPAVLNQSDPTNFAQIGTISFNKPNRKQGIPYLEYKVSGSSTVIAKELVFDPLSFCSATTGATPCIAMSTTLDVPFNGKQVLLEGSEEGDTVLVRKLRVRERSEPAFVPEPGNIFVSWPDAVKLLENCEVKMVMQTHALDVQITLKNDTEVQTVEPTIDEVFTIINRTQSKCGAFPVATE